MYTLYDAKTKQKCGHCHQTMDRQKIPKKDAKLTCGACYKRRELRPNSRYKWVNIDGVISKIKIIKKECQNKK